jgi:hypothetical protein
MFCGSCGARIEEDYLFCPECGTRSLVAVGEAAPPPPESAASLQPARTPGIHPSLDGAAGLLPGETVLKVFRAKSLGDLRTHGTKSASYYSGFLMVTARRLVFLIEVGTFQKRISKMEEIDLGMVQMVSIEGLLDKYLAMRHVRFNLI